MVENGSGEPSSGNCTGEHHCFGSQSSLGDWTDKDAEKAYQAGVLDGDGSIVNQIDPPSSGYKLAPRVVIEMNYVSGLTDTEGTIDPSIMEHPDTAIGYHSAVNFELKMSRCNSVLERLKGFADMMGIQYGVHFREHDNEDWADQFVFTISERDSVRRYLTALIPFLSVKRRQAEIMAYDIIPKLEKGYHQNRRGFLKLMYHVDRMNALKGGNRGKYNLEYFEDEWGMQLSDYDPYTEDN